MKADSLIRQNFSSYSCLYGHTPIQLQEDTSVAIPVYMDIHQYNYRRILQFLFLFIWAYINTTTGGYFSSYSCLYGHTPIQLQEDTSVPIPVYMGIHQYNYRRKLQFLFLFIWAYINTTTGGYFSSYSC